MVFLDGFNFECTESVDVVIDTRILIHAFVLKRATVCNIHMDILMNFDSWCGFLLFKLVFIFTVSEYNST